MIFVMKLGAYANPSQNELYPPPITATATTRLRRKDSTDENKKRQFAMIWGALCNVERLLVSVKASKLERLRKEKSVFVVGLIVSV